MQLADKTQKAAKAISQTIDKQDTSMAELLDAPAKPPQAAKVENAEATSNHKVTFLIAGAAILFAIGILLAVFTYVFLGTVLVVVATILILLGVFLPIH